MLVPLVEFLLLLCFCWFIKSSSEINCHAQNATWLFLYILECLKIALWKYKGQLPEVETWSSLGKNSATINKELVQEKENCFKKLFTVTCAVANTRANSLFNIYLNLLKHFWAKFSGSNPVTSSDICSWVISKHQIYVVPSCWNYTGISNNNRWILFSITRKYLAIEENYFQTFRL